MSGRDRHSVGIKVVELIAGDCVALPRCKPVTHEPQVAVESVLDEPVPLDDSMELILGVVARAPLSQLPFRRLGIDEGRVFAALRIDALHELHVLLRHRPRSMRRSSTSIATFPQVYARPLTAKQDVRRDDVNKKISSKQDESPAQLIDARIEELDDWRGELLSRLRALIKQADPEVVEEWKWRGVPVWSHDGMICTGETYKAVVKLTFAKGASLKDPSGLFNSSLDGNTRRAIDIREDEAIDEDAFTALIRAAVSLNESSRH